MPDKSTLLKTFNTQLFAFLDDVIAIFPENTDNKGVSLNCFNLIRTSVLHLNLYSIQYDMNNRRYRDVRFLN